MTFRMNLIPILLFGLYALAPLAESFKLHGLNYGPSRFRDECPSRDEIQQDLELIFSVTSRIKTFALSDFGQCDNVNLMMDVLDQSNLASQMNPQVELYLEAHIDQRNSELKRLIVNYPTLFQENVKLIVVGSETIFRAELQSSQLELYIGKVSELLKGNPNTMHINVTTSEVGGSYYSENLISVVDIVMPNLYPFWQGVSSNDAAEFQSNLYKDMSVRAKGKPVILGEIGWPTSGEQMGNAIPTTENAEKFLREVVCLAEREGLKYFWFEAFDEGWKPNFHNVEIHWGLFRADRSPKFDFNLECEEL